MIGQIFQGLNEFNLIILSAFLGGITAGLGAYLGSKIKNSYLCLIASSMF
jgi:hypothetical protein